MRPPDAPTVDSPACAESWDTSGPSRRRTSWSRGCGAWSTAATTPPASRWSPTGPSPTTSGPASSPTSRRRSARPRCPAPPPASGTPGGPPTAPPTTPTPTRTSAATAGSRWSTTGSSRTSRSCGTELEAAGHELLSETDTEVAAHLLELEVEGGRDLTTAMQAVCRRLEGAFTLVAVDSQDPDRVVAARRNSPLVVGIGEGENFLGSDVAAFIEHTREAMELGQDQVVTITREGVAVTGFDGTPAEGRRYHVDWDLSAAEKDGYDWFMRKEIYEQPRAVADSLLGRRTPTGLLQLDEMRLVRRGAPRHRQDHHHRVRHVVLRRHGRQVRHRALDPDPGRGRAGVGVPLPRPDPRPTRRWWWRSASPARPPTRCRRSGTPACSGRRCWRSATPTARPSRASPTR